MYIYATKPWAYPMTPAKPKTPGEPNSADTPEDIKRCLNCTLPDCKYQSVSACRCKRED